MDKVICNLPISPLADIHLRAFKKFRRNVQLPALPFGFIQDTKTKFSLFICRFTYILALKSGTFLKSY